MVRGLRARTTDEQRPQRTSDAGVKTIVTDSEDPLFPHRQTFPRNPAETMLVGKFVYRGDTRPGDATERDGTRGYYAGEGIIRLKRKKERGRSIRSGGPHPKLRIAILPWPWFRFCKVMLWRKVSGIYQESWYNFATTIDAMKRLAPPHLPPSTQPLSFSPRILFGSGKGNPCCRYPFTLEIRTTSYFRRFVFYST